MAYIPRPDSTFTMLVDIQQRLSALETSAPLSNAAIDGGALSVYNSTGQLVLQVGNIGGSGDYGIGVYDPGTNELVAVVDSNGLSIYDASNNLATLVGDLGSSEYGVEVLPAGAASGSELQRVGGAVSAVASNVSGVSGGGPYAFAPDSGLLYLPIGASGSALVTVTAGIATGGSGNQGIVYTSIDGVSGGPSISSSVSGSGVSGIAAHSSVVALVSGLTAGWHNFQPTYEINNAGTVNFTSVSITVQPL